MIVRANIEEFIDRLRPSEELLQELSGTGALTAGLSLKSAWRAAKRGDWSNCLQKSLDSKDRSWESLHRGVWHEVSYCHREAYGLAGCLHVISEAETEMEARDGSNLDREISNETAAGMVHDLDMVIMMSNPKVHGIAHEMIDLLSQYRSSTTTTATLVECVKRPPQQCEPSDHPSPVALSSKNTNIKRKRQQYDPSGSCTSGTVPEGGIPRVSNIDLDVFLETYLIPGRPVIITSYIDDWPAMASWPNMEYWRNIAGLRAVPVEVGGKYTSDGWGQRLMTMDEFISDHIEGSGGGYLAQHELLEQIPALKRDVLTPEYTSMLREDEEEESYTHGGVKTNIWFGPAGTISPCHTDPYHNLLAQVFGSKCVVLFPPETTSSLYPCEGLLSNTSQVDVLAPVEDATAKYPLFQNAVNKRLECTITSGDMLFIPPLWWHCVQAIERSCSVSFWWGKKRTKVAAS